MIEKTRNDATPAVEPGAHDRYRALFDAIDEGFSVVEVLFDPRGSPVDYRFLEVNPAFERHTGLRNAAGRTARELVPDLEEHWFRIYGHVAATGESARFVDEAPSMDGRTFNVFAFRLNGAEPNQVGILFTDVTEQRRVEAALRDREERLRLALEAAGMGVYSWDPVTDCTDADERLLRMVGLLPGEQLSLSAAMERNIHPDDRARYAAAARAMLDPNGPGRLAEEVRWRGSDGVERWLAFSGQAFFEGEGAGRRVVRAVGGVLDVTARKNLEQQKDEFVAMAAHELKTPVTTLKGYAQFLRNRFRRAGDEASAALMETIDAQADRLTALVGDLVDAARVQSGLLRLEPAPFDLDALVDERVAELQMTTERHRIRAAGRAGVRVVADRDRLGQVLTNLLSNAIAYSPDEGDIDVWAEAGSGEVAVCVRDNGIGLRTDDLQRVFDRFYRVDAARAAAPTGLGLGLYISAEIVRRHGGRIWAESAAGEGSTFCFSLPLAPPDPDVAAGGDAGQPCPLD